MTKEERAALVAHVAAFVARTTDRFSVGPMIVGEDSAGRPIVSPDGLWYVFDAHDARATPEERFLNGGRAVTPGMREEDAQDRLRRIRATAAIEAIIKSDSFEVRRK